MHLPVCLVRTLSLVLSTAWIVVAKRSPVTYCGACLGLVEEMNWGLGTTDSRKTIQVGSFRINSDGKQNLNQIPLKRSEAYIMELLEMACIEVGKYSESWNEQKQRANFIRPDARDGTKVSKSAIKKDEHMEKTLRFACDTLVEEHEDEIIQMYKKDEKDINRKLCVDIMGMCQVHNITEMKEARDQAVADAILEEANRNTAKRANPVSAQTELKENEDDEDDDDDDDDDIDDDNVDNALDNRRDPDDEEEDEDEYEKEEEEFERQELDEEQLEDDYEFEELMDQLDGKEEL